MNTSATTETSQLDALIQRINQLSASGAPSLESVEPEVPVVEKTPSAAPFSAIPTPAPAPVATNVDRDEPFVPAGPQDT